MRFRPAAHIHSRLTTCEALALPQGSMLPTVSSALYEYRSTSQIRARPSIVDMLKSCWGRNHTPRIWLRGPIPTDLFISFYFVLCQA